MAIADRSLEGVVEVERGAGRDVEQIPEAERIEICSDVGDRPSEIRLAIIGSEAMCPTYRGLKNGTPSFKPESRPNSFCESVAIDVW